jgi:alcohol dehydrogenase class IV
MKTKTAEQLKENAIFKTKPAFAKSWIIISEDEEVFVVTDKQVVECKTSEQIRNVIKGQAGNIGWYAEDKDAEMTNVEAVIDELYFKDYIN